MKRNSIDGDADGNNDNSGKLMVPCGALSTEEDIISNLPFDIVDKILVCLPIEDAARTSILSTKWRCRWLSISQLSFQSISLSSISPEVIWSRILQILLVHHGPLPTLFIYGYELGGNGDSILDQIIFILSGKDVQELALLPLPTGTRYTLPPSLFLCTHITYLCLGGCRFRIPPDYIGFNKLISVVLAIVDFTADDFKNFLSKCPLLQQLSLQMCKTDPIETEIDAPNLEYLYFDCSQMSLLLKNVPVLSIFEIRSSIRLAGSSLNIVNMFASLPSIEVFSAGKHFLMDLNAGVVLKRLPVMLNKLKVVQLFGLHLNSSKEVQFALLMIRSSPNLRKLQIRLEEHEDGVDDVPIKSLFLVEDSFNQLCEIEMKDFKGTVCQLEFMEFLLAKSTALEKIRIRPSKEISDEKVVGILKAVTEFERASPEAQIVLLERAEVEEVDDNVASYLLGNAELVRS